MSRTILTTANSRGIDLLNPKVTDIDFAVIAEHLAKDNRYCGATKGLVYSVAEHTSRGVDAILAATGDRNLAAYFLCHDMPEAYLGDDTTPKKRALSILAQEQFGVLASDILRTFDSLTGRFDKVIHEAAGLYWPLTREMERDVKHWDNVMLTTEWRFLMRCPAPFIFDAPAMDEPINPMQWEDARYYFYRHCTDLLPGLNAHQELVRQRETS